MLPGARLQSAQSLVPGHGSDGGASGSSGASSNRPVPPTFTTFKGILNSYIGDVKTWMETGGACRDASIRRRVSKVMGFARS